MWLAVCDQCICILFYITLFRRYSFRQKSLEFTTVAHCHVSAYYVIMLVCWSLYELCCLCVCVVDGDETRCLSRRDSNLRLSSRTLVDTWRIVSRVPAEMSRNTALKLRTILAVWPLDSLWDRCLLTAKFRSAFCSWFLAKSSDRRRWAADHESTARRLHIPHICDVVLPAAHPNFCQVSVRTSWCNYSCSC